jgi:hypothetical protein
MSSIKDFMFDKALIAEQQDVPFTRKDPKTGEDKTIVFTIRSLNSDEVDEAQRRATTRTKDKKTRQFISESDPSKFMDNMIEKSVIVPDLQDAQLQEYWGTQGSAIRTLKAMLKAGEYADLATQVSALSGYDEDVDDLVDEIKN